MKAFAYFALHELKTHWPAYATIIVVLSLVLVPLSLSEAYTTHMNEVSREVMHDMYTADARLVTRDDNAWSGFYSMEAIDDAEAIARELQRQEYGAIVEASAFVMPMYGYDEGPPLELRGIYTADPSYDIQRYIVRGTYFEDVVYTKAHGYGASLPSLFSPELNTYMPYPALMSVSRASSLGIGVGDVITAPSFTALQPILGPDDIDTMLANIPDVLRALVRGSALSTQIEIIGLYETPFDLPEVVTVFMPIESVREINGWGSEKGTAVRVSGDYESLDSFEAEIEALTGLTAVTWHDGVVFGGGGMYDMMSEAVALISAAFLLIIFVFSAAWFVSLVKKKQHELSMLRAHGLNQSALVGMFLFIGAVIGILTGVAALCLSILLMGLLEGGIVAIPGMPFNTTFTISFAVTETILIREMLFPIVVCMAVAALAALRSYTITPIRGMKDGALSL